MLGLKIKKKMSKRNSSIFVEFEQGALLINIFQSYSEDKLNETLCDVTQIVLACYLIYK